MTYFDNSNLNQELTGKITQCNLNRVSEFWITNSFHNNKYEFINPKLIMLKQYFTMMA
jgi:hypothetical protein